MAMIMRSSKNQEFVPLDLVIEILTRLPVKSVGRFLLVSKTWAKIIRSKAFIKAFPFRSLTQPWRVLIALPEYPTQPGEETTWFFSYSSTASLSFLSKYSTPINYQDDYHSCFVNGLMSRAGTISNPSTGKSITLPQIKTDTSTVIRRFFGYEPVNAEYKMLSVTMTVGDPCVKFKVFTLGTEQKEWRLVDCKIPHKPRININGVCIDGAVYYIAYAGTEQSLMRFDLKSEKFDIFARVSQGVAFAVDRYSVPLINYYGKVALRIHPFDNNESAVDLRVFKEAGKQDVLEMCVVELPEVYLFIKGTTHTGEMIFVNTTSTEANVICCDRKASSFKKLKIEGLPYRRYYNYINYYMDYVESLMLL